VWLHGRLRCNGLVKRQIRRTSCTVSPMPRQFLIVTQADDLHGLAVQAAVRRRGFDCHIFESDQLSGRESITYAIGAGEGAEALLRTADGQIVDVASLEAIWWRRFGMNQDVGSDELSEVQRDLINNDCVGAAIGALQNAFSGRWVSQPSATLYASNKLNQLATAHRCGMRIPDTIVTQSPSVVREFWERHQRRIIVKPVVGTFGPMVCTQFVREEHFRADDSIRSAPAIYQEYIPGTSHIRLNCFGDRSYAGLIESEDLDWRPNLNVPISRWPVPDSLHRLIRKILDQLGLAMGIIDLKQTPEGEFVWLEVNPQGQFLFLEGLTGEPLTEHFADYLTDFDCGWPHSGLPCSHVSNRGEMDALLI
jgi:glutathione synthase/RimK-type ligase-like ATP-grasp enzyme